MWCSELGVGRRVVLPLLSYAGALLLSIQSVYLTEFLSLAFKAHAYDTSWTPQPGSTLGSWVARARSHLHLHFSLVQKSLRLLQSHPFGASELSIRWG